MKNLFQTILSLFTRNEHSPQVKQHFYRWLVDREHAVEKDEALQGLWGEALMKEDVPDLEESLERWKQSYCPSSSPQPKKSILMPYLRFWQSAAAVLLIVSGSFGYLLYKTAKPEVDLLQQFVPTTRMKTFLLPDGSCVQMNSSSALLYPKQFTGENRSVYLIGEANFKIKPDKRHPFIVKTDNFQITALGTEFNVSAYAGEQEVHTTLISGSILVEFDNLTEKTLLRPKEQLVYNKGNHQYAVNHPDMEDVTAWQRGELVFRQMTLADVITVLERKYDYQFIYSLHSLKKDRFSFRFNKDAPLPEVMDVVVDVVGNLSFTIQGDTCYIKQK